MFKGLNAKVFLSFLVYLVATTTNAYSLPTWLNPVATLELGTSIEKLGDSQSFQPLDLCTYSYSANTSSSARFLGGFFLGSELTLPTNLPFVADIGMEYNQSSTFSANGRLIQGADSISSDTYHYGYRVQSRQVLLDGKIQWDAPKKFYLYGLLGLGIAINNAHSYHTTVPDFYEYTPAYLSHKQTHFSYSLGVGAGVRITNMWRLGLGYRFTDLGQANLGNGHIDIYPISNTLKQSNLHANEVFAELTYLPLSNS